MRPDGPSTTATSSKAQLAGDSRAVGFRHKHDIPTARAGNAFASFWLGGILVRDRIQRLDGDVHAQEQEVETLGRFERTGQRVVARRQAPGELLWRRGAGARGRSECEKT